MSYFLGFDIITNIYSAVQLSKTQILLVGETFIRWEDPLFTYKAVLIDTETKEQTLVLPGAEHILFTHVFIQPGGSLVISSHDGMVGISHISSMQEPIEVVAELSMLNNVSSNSSQKIQVRKDKVFMVTAQRQVVVVEAYRRKGDLKDEGGIRKGKRPFVYEEDESQEMEYLEELEGVEDISIHRDLLYAITDDELICVSLGSKKKHKVVKRDKTVQFKNEEMVREIKGIRPKASESSKKDNILFKNILATSNWIFCVVSSNTLEVYSSSRLMFLDRIGLFYEEGEKHNPKRRTQHVACLKEVRTTRMKIVLVLFRLEHFHGYVVCSSKLLRLFSQSNVTLPIQPAMPPHNEDEDNIQVEVQQNLKNQNVIQTGLIVMNTFDSVQLFVYGTSNHQKLFLFAPNL